LESVAATGGQKSNQSDVGVLKENFHLKRTKEKHFFISSFVKISHGQTGKKSSEKPSISNLRHQ
jgi:hypothetical protein